MSAGASSVRVQAATSVGAVRPGPELVRRYIERNLPDDQSPAGVRLSQVGEMQLKAGRWSPFRASQTMAVDRVEFAWHANFRMLPLVSVRVRDWYRAGAGGLAVRLWDVIPIVNAEGDEVARGEAMRYLAELPLVPHAMVANPALRWRVVDESTVEVATCVGPERVAVSLHFDADGDIVAMSAAARERGVGKRAVATPWSGKFGEYREFDGIRVPTKAEVSWVLPDGQFTYFRCRVTNWCVDSAQEGAER